jgi:hypothetical protein
MRNSFIGKAMRATSVTARNAAFLMRGHDSQTVSRQSSTRDSDRATNTVDKSPVPQKRDLGPSLQAFSEEAAIDTYLSKLANELMLIAERPGQIFKAQEVDPEESLTQAVDVLQAAADSLASVQARADRHVNFLHVCRASLSSCYFSILYCLNCA